MPVSILPSAPVLPDDWLQPSLGAGVGACMTARSLHHPAAHSLPPYDGFNVGTHVGDATEAVAANRAFLSQAIGQPVCWLNQVHGNHVVQARANGSGSSDVPDADGSWTTEPGVACAVMVADCLPVLLAAPDGRGVAALHAGWRGLAGAGAMQGQGILESGVRALCEAAAVSPQELVAWLGPCIGPTRFEVGADVLAGFGVSEGDTRTDDWHRGFKRAVPKEPKAGQLSEPKWWADLPELARTRLNALGVRRVDGGQWCTASDSSRFFSFRRDRVTGRQVACIWLTDRG